MFGTSPELDRSVARRILEAAVRLFAEKGFAATTTREIVVAAGITKPMLYYYFGSKEGVCRAALTEYIQEAKRELEQILEADLDPTTQLAEFVWVAFRTHRDNPDFFRMAMAMLYSPEGGVPGVDIRSHARDVSALFLRVARNACDGGLVRPGCEEALARSLDATMFAWSHSPLFERPVELTRELAQQVVEDLVYGFAPR